MEGYKEAAYELLTKPLTQPSVIGLLIAARRRELLVMHNLAAMAATEQAAPFAARCPRADVSV